MSGLLGSAAWSEDQGHWRYTRIGADGAPVALDGGRFLLLGEAVNIHGNLHVRAPRQHMLTIAPTRSGKGVSLIIPNLLNYAGAVLVIDPKGENAWITAAFRRKILGQKTFIVDPWGEVNRRYGSIAAEMGAAEMGAAEMGAAEMGRGGAPEVIASFNPLSILKPGSDDFIEDLTYLADALIITQSTKDPYWEDTARELWAGLMAFVVEHPDYAPHASLPLARMLLMQSNESLQRTIRTAIGLGPGSVAALKLAQFDNPEKSTSIASVISAARTQTVFLDSPVLKQRMETSDFSFDQLCDGNISVYLVLPPDKLETYARWLRLMVSAGIRAVARGSGASRLPNASRPQAAIGLPALFILDEFGTIGKLNAVAQAYGLMAGLGMIMWTFSQDLNQLVRDYPQHWETFIANSQAVTCFGVMDNFTAEYVSKFLGTATIQQENVSTSVSSSKAPLGPGQSIFTPRTSHSTSTSVSVQTMSRSLLNPDEVRNLRQDRCIIMGRFEPILARRIVYQEDWDFLHRAREDPHFPRTEDVRWRAFERRLEEMGSVARLLKEYGYEVKALRRGRWEVSGSPGTGKPAHTFASDKDLWRWTYVLVMDSVDSA
jgi:type IV secretion system protein VirD4